MALRTRGSAALDKAQRRSALLKAIDENLDLGYGLTLEAYDRLIAETRAALENYNKLLSETAESRKILTHMDRTLSDLSSRMLSGVASRYGRSSIEYIKAGGSPNFRHFQSTPSQPPQSGQVPSEQNGHPANQVSI
ncbi:MAG: hypothetical protein VKK04_13215 [Synechococcales bacterium]|nr:hypothetical protein [Synechococcales bacterium]